MRAIRYELMPSVKNGLQSNSQVMIDKVMQVEKSHVQKIIGSITKKQMSDIESRLLAILGIN